MLLLQIQVLEESIYQNIHNLTMSGFKMDLLPYLEISRSQTKRISFTVFSGAFNLRSQSLIEYLMHSLTFIFLFAPLIQQ